MILSLELQWLPYLVFGIWISVLKNLNSKTKNDGKHKIIVSFEFGMGQTLEQMPTGTIYKCELLWNLRGEWVTHQVVLRVKQRKPEVMGNNTEACSPRKLPRSLKGSGVTARLSPQVDHWWVYCPSPKAYGGEERRDSPVKMYNM